MKINALLKIVNKIKFKNRSIKFSEPSAASNYLSSLYYAHALTINYATFRCGQWSRQTLSQMHLRVFVRLGIGVGNFHLYVTARKGSISFIPSCNGKSFKDVSKKQQQSL